MSLDERLIFFLDISTEPPGLDLFGNDLSTFAGASFVLCTIFKARIDTLRLGAGFLCCAVIGQGIVWTEAFLLLAVRRKR
jgi:hypothetical protein